MRIPLLLLFGVFGIQSAQAMTCAQVREKAKPGKTGKAACVLLEHTVGLSRGSTLSIYQCGKSKYTLNMYENNDCKVSGK
jgi:hypothetical protein